MEAAINGLFWCMSLVLTEPNFLVKWRPVLEPQSLSKGPLRFLLAAALEHWDLYARCMDGAAYLYWVDNGVDDPDLHEEYRQIYADVTSAYPITDSSREAAWTSAEEWIQDYNIGMALDRARASLVAGDRPSAFEELLNLREVTGEKEAESPISLEEERLGELLAKRPKYHDACPTGIPAVDELWEGGVYPGNLALAAGDTNIGKSMLLCQLACASYLADKRVLYFSYELTKVQVAERILTGLFTCSKRDIKSDTIVDQLLGFREKNDLTKGSLVIDDGSNIHTVADLERRLETENIDLVLLDSADDLVPAKRYNKQYEGYHEIYRDLRINVCQGLGYPLWTTVQLNREAVEKAKVSLKHIGDAFAKAQRAHLVLGMSQTPDELDDPMGPKVKLWILKDTEHGAKGKWSLQRTMFGRGSDGWPGFVHEPTWENVSV